MKTATPQAPIDIAFLANVDDQELEILIDIIVNPPAKWWSPLDAFVAEKRGVEYAPGKSWPMRILMEFPELPSQLRILIESHGVKALYVALEAAGRTRFRDACFGADLGL